MGIVELIAAMALFFAGAALKEKEIEETVKNTPPAVERTPTKIEQVDKACEKRSIAEYSDHGFRFKCNTEEWR